MDPRTPAQRFVRHQRAGAPKSDARNAALAVCLAALLFLFAGASAGVGLGGFTATPWVLAAGCFVLGGVVLTRGLVVLLAATQGDRPHG